MNSLVTLCNKNWNAKGINLPLQSYRVSFPSDVLDTIEDGL